MGNLGRMVSPPTRLWNSGIPKFSFGILKYPSAFYAKWDGSSIPRIYSFRSQGHMHEWGQINDVRSYSWSLKSDFFSNFGFQLCNLRTVIQAGAKKNEPYHSKWVSPRQFWTWSESETHVPTWQRKKKKKNPSVRKMAEFMGKLSGFQICCWGGILFRVTPYLCSLKHVFSHHAQARTPESTAARDAAHPRA